MATFCTPIHSDPRRDGRSYTVQADVTLHPSVLALTLALSATLFGLRLRAETGEERRRSLDRLIVGVLAVMALILAAVAAGLLPALNRIAGPPKDAALVLTILGHLGLGALLFVVSAALAAACGRLQFGRSQVTLPELLLVGYPGAMIVLAAASAVALTAPFGAIWGAAICPSSEHLAQLAA